jgi:hypothetical protein
MSMFSTVGYPVRSGTEELTIIIKVYENKFIPSFRYANKANRLSGEMHLQKSFADEYSAFSYGISEARKYISERSGSVSLAKLADEKFVQVNHVRQLEMFSNDIGDR